MINPGSPAILLEITMPSRIARFFLAQHTKILVQQTKMRKICQMAIKYTQMAIKIPIVNEIHQKFPFQGLPKHTKIGIVGMKIRHLALLMLPSAGVTYSFLFAIEMKTFSVQRLRGRESIFNRFFVF
jgi:hypothetical protein